MRHLICCVLLFTLLSACSSLENGFTPPTKESSNFVESPPSEISILPSEDYFAQRIEYIDTNSSIPYSPPVGTSVYALTSEAAPGLTLAQELVTEDTLGWLPRTLSYSPDGNLYAFWAGNDEGASLYCLYFPTGTLDCLYSISGDELEQYYYTIQTEAAAALLCPGKPLEDVVGEQVCLIGYTEIASNQEFLWGAYDPLFLALFEDMAAHREDYPQYEWDKLSYEDVANLYVESDSGLTLALCHYYNSVTGEHKVHSDRTYGTHDYWWATE